MMMIQMFSLILLFYITFASTTEHIILPVNNKGFEMQQSASNCILNIANKNFVFGSNVGIVASTSHSRINHVLSTNSYDVIRSTVMSEMRWTIFMKDESRYVDRGNKVSFAETIIGQLMRVAL